MLTFRFKQAKPIMQSQSEEIKPFYQPCQF